MQKKYLYILLALVITAVAGGVVAGRWYNDNRRPNFTERYVLLVRSETTVDVVLDSLQTGAGALRSRSLVRGFNQEKVAEKIKPGRYVIEPSFTSVYVARMLNNGWQTPGNMTLSGTIRTKARLAQNGLPCLR